MNRRRILVEVACAAVALGGVALVPSVSMASGGGASATTVKPLPAHSQRSVCDLPAAGRARCHAHVVTHKDSAVPLATAQYESGWAAQDLQAAYSLPVPSTITPGSGPTVAIVDAYDNPNAESDLAAYRTEFGLGACHAGCFTKVNQTGGSTPPTPNADWGAEIDLDIEMVAAACPNCKILLVEANSNSFGDLMTAVSYAAGHAQFISNSYGAPEFSSETAFDGYFNHPGVGITVSSGDNGYGVEYPAASQYVTAVGGTSLTQDSSTSRGWTETAWSGAGSGCSAVEPKPSWQKDSCARRTVADVSAVANPSTGVAVYDSYGSTAGNWYVYGGTSVAAPLVAGIWALGPGVASTALGAAIPYANTSGFNDVVGGTNTGHCRSGYLCTAVAGYDGPTGWGTPNGVAGFNSTSGGSSGGGGGTTATKVHVDSISYTKSKNAMLIPVHVVNSSGASVPNATVSISLSGPASGTASAATGSNGTVTFRVSRAPAGTYTTTVTNITGTNLSWDHTGVTTYTAAYSG